MPYVDEIARKQKLRKSLAPELNKFHNRDIPRPNNLSPQSEPRGRVNVNDERALASAYFGVDLTHDDKNRADLNPYGQPSHGYGRRPIRGMPDDELIESLFGRNPHLEKSLRFGQYDSGEAYANDPRNEIERRLLKTRNPKFFFALLQHAWKNDPHFDEKSMYDAYRDKIDWIRPPKY